MDGLSIKQKKFVEYYIQSGNATAAYKQAGYTVKNDNVASSLSSRLLRNDKVQKKIQEISTKTEKSSIATSEEVQQKLTEIIRDESGAVRISDKIRAVETLSKINGWLMPPDTSVTIPQNPFEGSDPDDLLTALKNINADYND